MITGLRIDRAPTRRGIARFRPLVVLLLILAAGATSKVFVDAVHWRDQIAEARGVLRDPSSSEKQRRAAIIVLQRHGEEMLRELRSIAASEDPNAAIASNAIHWITEAGK